MTLPPGATETTARENEPLSWKAPTASRVRASPREVTVPPRNSTVALEKEPNSSPFVVVAPASVCASERSEPDSACIR